MLRAVERLGLEKAVDRWRALRDDIHREVCGKGSTPTAARSPSITAGRGSARLSANGPRIVDGRGSHRGEQEGQDEPERGRQGDEGPALLVRLGHERVCQGGDDGAGGEGERQ
jgi:hypothetical protein